MKLNLPPKLVEKLVWVSVISFFKISFPVTRWVVSYAETGLSRLPNRLTLQITLLSFNLNKTWVNVLTSDVDPHSSGRLNCMSTSIHLTCYGIPSTVLELPPLVVESGGALL
jgi:hypothetical protein